MYVCMYMYYARLCVCMYNGRGPSRVGKGELCVYVCICICVCMYSCRGPSRVGKGELCVYVCICMYVYVYVCIAVEGPSV